MSWELYTAFTIGGISFLILCLIFIFDQGLTVWERRRRIDRINKMIRSKEEDDTTPTGI
jgi:hypothetical protein